MFGWIYSCFCVSVSVHVSIIDEACHSADVDVVDVLIFVRFSVSQCMQIILVDDASTMQHLKQPLEQEIRDIPKVVLRHPPDVGSLHDAGEDTSSCRAVGPHTCQSGRGADCCRPSPHFSRQVRTRTSGLSLLALGQIVFQHLLQG
jgi:hypothetical protein